MTTCETVIEDARVGVVLEVLSWRRSWRRIGEVGRDRHFVAPRVIATACASRVSDIGGVFGVARRPMAIVANPRNCQPLC